MMKKFASSSFNASAKLKKGLQHKSYSILNLLMILKVRKIITRLCSLTILRLQKSPQIRIFDRHLIVQYQSRKMRMKVRDTELYLGLLATLKQLLRLQAKP
jgi:hypothetical protein